MSQTKNFFQRKLSNSFRYRDPTPNNLVSDDVYKFPCRLCNESYYGESFRHLDIWSREHISVLPLTEKKIKTSNNSAVCDLVVVFSPEEHQDNSQLWKLYDGHITFCWISFGHHCIQPVPRTLPCLCKGRTNFITLFLVGIFL